MTINQILDELENVVNSEDNLASVRLYSEDIKLILEKIKQLRDYASNVINEELC